MLTLFKLNLQMYDKTDPPPLSQRYLLNFISLSLYSWINTSPWPCEVLVLDTNPADSRCRIAGHTFPFYNEAPITFLPTYKYDIGTSVYDTSYVRTRHSRDMKRLMLDREKARIPAWCDRILWKAPNLKQIDYNTAPLRFSDHRPVFATFQCLVECHDEAEKQRLGRDIYLDRRREVGGLRNGFDGAEIDREEDISGYESIAPGLSPASSERRKWWLNNS